MKENNNYELQKSDNLGDLTIKLKSSEFEKKTNNFKTLDSVVYLCHGVANTFSICYLSTVHLV